METESAISINYLQPEENAQTVSLLNKTHQYLNFSKSHKRS